MSGYITILGCFESAIAAAFDAWIWVVNFTGALPASFRAGIKRRKHASTTRDDSAACVYRKDIGPNRLLLGRPTATLEANRAATL